MLTDAGRLAVYVIKQMYEKRGEGVYPIWGLTGMRV